MSVPEGFGEVQMLGRWPVLLPDYRVEHCAQHANWEYERLISMHSLLAPGMVLYDVGSEHGDLSALYGTWVRDYSGTTQIEHPDGTRDPVQHFAATGGVVLVEGSEKFWPVIRHTFAANNLTPVACWAGFVSNVDSDESERTPSWATPTFTQPRQDNVWPSWADGDLIPHHGFRSVVESGRTLPNIRFDTLATKTAPPDAMTIDVEGAELLVLQGSERILREHRPIVWVSIHPTLIAMDYPESGIHGSGDPDRERERVIQFMDSCGYDATHLETDHEEHFLFQPRP